MSYSKFQDESDKLFEWREKNNLPKQHYEKTFADLRDIWIKDGRYSELIAFIHENWDSGQWNEFHEPLEKHLLENSLTTEYKRFWKGLLRHRISDLWYLTKELEQRNVDLSAIKGNTLARMKKTLGFGEDKLTRAFKKRVIQKQAETLEGFSKYIRGLKTLGEVEEIKKAKSMVRQVRLLERPKPQKTTDKRKIDESLFWELIEDTRAASEDKWEFVERLEKRIEEFKPEEIRRFERIFKTKVQELNQWDIWALAYLARKGCGDDAFDYFKAWIVSKGKEAFTDIKNLNVNSLKKYFDEDPQLEEMIGLAENAFENKTGDLMPPTRVKKQKLLGKEWEEESVHLDFPEIADIFEYKK